MVKRRTKDGIFYHGWTQMNTDEGKGTGGVNFLQKETKETKETKGRETRISRMDTN